MSVKTAQTHVSMSPQVFLQAHSSLPLVIAASVLLASLLPRSVAATTASCYLGYKALQLLGRSYGVLSNPRTKNIETRKITGLIEGDFVVFLIGARSNGPAFFSKDFQAIGEGMTAMIAELEASDPEISGYLGQEQFLGGSDTRGSHTLQIQYWRSVEHLRNYAHESSKNHMSFWPRAQKIIAASPNIGIWHETYSVKAGHYEGIYANMPPFGLGRAHGVKTVPAIGNLKTMKGRFGDAFEDVTKGGCPFSSPKGREKVEE
ncbi:hypothetical protein BDK51DRAFT_46373 [Blyttiomyces helicus]|uniref:Uncharacterized protein n=1 Tax=Blyttiomyces helicus TaxID=388810 RepID=A0A4V1ISB9_9FUNG|nr:hypothetical protein BDK51DRAFT_46373 [Blyttiomyces helicus]|eukprot:RKO93017.1 hypothetical protein BDK51DRAFT_46373 [Blyttiomyces helicus]